MYRFINGMSSYSLFNTIGTIVALVSSLFFFKSKRKAISLYSGCAIRFVSSKNSILGKIVEFLLVSVEAVAMAELGVLSTSFNVPFGEFVGTGVNYFGGLSAFLLLWVPFTLIIMANPLKSIDVATFTLPIRLIFVKIACFLNGCCWGIPWEYGPYNHHYHHPGNQVPVQAIEAFWALAILVFLLIYRKKAKVGTIFPMYVILYCGTRFFSEFLRADEPNVFWIFKTYHLLCIAGFAIGVLMFIFVRKFGETMSDFFDKPHIKAEMKFAQREEIKNLEIEEEKRDRAEKAKLARAKAKARCKK